MNFHQRPKQGQQYDVDRRPWGVRMGEIFTRVFVIGITVAFTLGAMVVIFRLLGVNQQLTGIVVGAVLVKLIEQIPWSSRP